MEFNIFIGILFGLWVGDYWLQPKWMAIMKGQKGWKGFLVCVLHSVIYTLTTCLFLWHISPLLFCAIFVSHFFIDRYSLALVWLRLIHGRDFYAEKDIDYPDNWSRVLVPFACDVYIQVDNSMHIVLLWYMLSWLVHLGLLLL